MTQQCMEAPRDSEPEIGSRERTDLIQADGSPQEQARHHLKPTVYMPTTCVELGMLES